MQEAQVKQMQKDQQAELDRQEEINSKRMKQQAEQAQLQLKQQQAALLLKEQELNAKAQELEQYRQQQADQVLQCTTAALCL